MEVFRPSGIAASFHYLVRSLSCVLRADIRLVECRFASAESDTGNLIANVAPDDRHLVASGIVGAFKSIWRDSWGPRLEYILYNAIAALLDCPNTSLLGVNRMLTDTDYRRCIVEKVRDPFVRAFWTEEYESYDARFQREAIAPIQNKVGQFLLIRLSAISSVKCGRR